MKIDYCKLKIYSMKPFFKQFLKYYLKIITKIVLFIHQPKIIAVAGSTNKSFVRDEIKRIISEKGRIVRANPKNFNTEIGLPLAILGIESGYGSYLAWPPVMLSAARAAFQKNFPRVLVLELGVSKRGDMKYLLSIVKPEISVVTDITQRYIESFSGLDRMVREYEYLVKNTKEKGMVILNHDNLQVRALAGKSKAKVEFFGRTASAERSYKIEGIEKISTGQRVTLAHADQKKTLEIPRFGEHHAYATAAAEIIKEAF